MIFVVDAGATNNSALQEYQTGLKQTYENLPLPEKSFNTGLV